MGHVATLRQVAHQRLEPIELEVLQRASHSQCLLAPAYAFVLCAIEHQNQSQEATDPPRVRLRTRAAVLRVVRANCAKCRLNTLQILRKPRPLTGI